MISLGIESSAYVFGVGIIDDKGNVLADKRFFFKPEKGKGMIPREASEAFMKNAKSVLLDALDEAKISIKDVNVISFTQGMGIPNNLRVGATLARFLSIKYKKPLVGINHALGHIEIGKFFTGAKDPVVLYLSGGNTQIIAASGKRYRIFGETEDIAIGNALDALARKMGFEMPGGPKIEELAKKGKYVKLPYVVKGMDVSFSGILTDAIRKLEKGIPKEDIAYSFQETCFAMLTEATERAMAHTGKEELLLVGGVGANKRLRKMLKTMCKDRGATFYLTPLKYCGDNGVMTALVGLKYFKYGITTPLKNSGIRQKWRIDEIDIPWLH